MLDLNWFLLSLRGSCKSLGLMQQRPKSECFCFNVWLFTGIVQCWLCFVLLLWDFWVTCAVFFRGTLFALYSAGKAQGLFFSLALHCSLCWANCKATWRPAQCGLRRGLCITMYNHTGYFFWSKTTDFLECCHSIRNNCCPRKQMLQANFNLWLLTRKQGECDDSKGKTLFSVSIAEFKLWRDSSTILCLWRPSPNYGNFQQQTCSDWAPSLKGK